MGWGTKDFIIVSETVGTSRDAEEEKRESQTVGWISHMEIVT